MNPRGTLMRVKKFQVDEKRRQVLRIEGMLATLETTANELETEGDVEQYRASTRNASRFAHLTCGTGATQRRENLKRSVDDLKTELDVAKSALTDVLDELQVLKLREGRRQVPIPNHYAVS